MTLKPEERQEIVDLRRKGYNYRQIQTKTGHSLPTISKYLEEAELAPIVMLKKLHNEILEREHEMGALDEQLEAAHWPVNSKRAKENIEKQNQLGNEITDRLWEIRSILFDL